MQETLPGGWLSTELNNLISIDGLVSDGDWIESKDQDPSGNIRLIQLADIGDGFFKNKSDRYINLETFKKLQCTELKEDDLLIARLPDPLGRCCLFPKIETQAITVVDVCIVRSGTIGFNNSWFMYWLNSPQLRKVIEVESSGTTRKRIARKKLESLIFPLPPLAEQQEIATRLDALLAQVDAIKARLDALPAILKRFRQAVLAAAVSGKLTEDWRETQCLPLMFDEKSIEAIVSSNKYSLGIGPFGSNLKVDDYRDNGHPLIFVREIRANSFGDLKTKYVNQEKFDELKAHRAKPGVILITKMGDPPGDVAIYPSDRPEAVITADCIKLEVNEAIVNKSYVYYCMQDLGFREEVLKISAGVAQQKVNLRSFRKLALKLPPLPEQTEIVNRVEQLFAFADQIEQQVQAAQTRVNQLTQAILAKAFKGELTADWRAAHPELISGENSAEALLEKIKATQTPAKPKRGSLKLAI